VGGEKEARVLSSLKPREERVLRMRSSRIGMNTDHTLDELGQQFNMSANASGRSRRRRCAS
jgi:RNA polymerase primary sigma factor